MRTDAAGQFRAPASAALKKYAAGRGEGRSGGQGIEYGFDQGKQFGQASHGLFVLPHVSTAASRRPGCGGISNAAGSSINRARSGDNAAGRDIVQIARCWTGC
ncbi:hypothetical protein Lfu02_76070 [Longispora fulva]|nr:hypothetical protein Lfu02_76070 [Longispora fulva]